MFDRINDKLWRRLRGRGEIMERAPHLTLIGKIANQWDDRCTRRLYLARDLLESRAAASAKYEAASVLREVVSSTTAEMRSAPSNEHAAEDALSVPASVSMCNLRPAANWPQRLRASQPVQEGDRTQTNPTPGFRGSPCPVQPTLAGLTSRQQSHRSIPRSYCCWRRALPPRTQYPRRCSVNRADLP